jgi:quinol monooxygenase YgiN
MDELLIKVRARDDKISELLQTSQHITERTLQIPGCINSILHQAGDKGALITLKQKWDNRSSLNNYFRSDHFTALLGAMKWLGKSYDIRINGGTHEEGMKIIKFERGS